MKTWTNPYVALVLAILGLSASVLSAQFEGATDVHSHHHMMVQTTYRLVDYKLPRIQLVREDGKSVSFVEEMNDGRPVVLNFIYTTCTTICPVTSHTFAELQNKLGGGRERVHMVSISIDPEQDTPEVLAKYAKRFEAGGQWQFYTGTMDASIAAQRAFDVYRGDKMNHNPVTFIRNAPDKLWLRIDGFAKSDELIGALRDMGIPKDGTPSDTQLSRDVF